MKLDREVFELDNNGRELLAAHREGWCDRYIDLISPDSRS